MKYTTETFIEKANQIHNNKYHYNNVSFQNVHTKIEIICPIHGVFKQLPKDHLRGRGCPKCKNNSKRLGLDTFIEKANSIFNNTYDYSQVEYVNNKTPVDIMCNKHGIFQQKPLYHLEGCGCPKCNMSKGEIRILLWMKRNNIQTETQKKFKSLGKLSYDFYIPSKKILIEYNGEQHYKYNSHFHKDLHNFHYQKHKDWLKRKYATNNGYRLIVIPYWSFDIIEVILDAVFHIY